MAYATAGVYPTRRVGTEMGASAEIHALRLASHPSKCRSVLLDGNAADRRALVSTRRRAAVGGSQKLRAREDRICRQESRSAENVLGVAGLDPESGRDRRLRTRRRSSCNVPASLEVFFEIENRRRLHGCAKR